MKHNRKRNKPIRVQLVLRSDLSALTPSVQNQTVLNLCKFRKRAEGFLLVNDGTKPFLNNKLVSLDLSVYMNIFL